LMSWIFF